MVKKDKFKKWFARWIDQWKLAGRGIILATRKKRFLIGAIISFIMFGTLLNLLSGGTAAFNLMKVSDLSGKLKIIGEAFFGIFGIGQNFLDWLLTFAISLLQATLVGLTVMIWDWRNKEDNDADNLQRTGIVAGLAVLGSGCPTCGTTLLAPLLASVVGSGGLAIAGAISGVLTTLAIIIGVFALKQLGYEAYVIIIDEKYRRKHARKNN